MIRELRNKIFTQTLLAISQVAFPLITYPVVTKALGAEGLGKVNFADSIVQTLLIIASLGIPLYGIREIALVKNNKEEQSKIGSELFSLQVLASLPAAVCIWILGLLSEVDHDLLWTGTIALISSCLTSEWFFHGNQNFHYIAYRTILTRTLTTILIYFLIKDPGDYVLYYILLAGNVVLTFLMNFVMISKAIKLTTRHIDPWRHIKKINWIFACYIFASFYTVLDSLMLGWMSTDEAVGRYSFGYKLIRMSAMLIPTLGLVFIPRIASNHAEENRQGVEEQISISQQLIFFICIPLSLVFFILAPEIIAVFATGDFAETVMVIRILSPVPLLTAFTHLTGTQILVSIRKEKVFFMFLATGFLLNFLIDFGLIPYMQEKAAAISNLTTEIFVAVGTYLYVRSLGLLGARLKQFLSFFLSSLILIPVVYGLRYYELAPLWVLVYSLPVTALLYLAMHYRFLKRNQIISSGNNN